MFGKFLPGANTLASFGGYSRAGDLMYVQAEPELWRGMGESAGAEALSARIRGGDHHPKVGQGKLTLIPLLLVPAFTKALSLIAR